MTRHDAAEVYADILAAAQPVRWECGGWTCRCPLPDRHKRGDLNPSCRLIPGGRGLSARCLGCGAGFRDIAQALGTRPADWFHDRHERMQRMHGQTHPRPKPVARYEYRTADGTLEAVKIRMEPGYHGRGKTFVWERPVPADIRLMAGVPERAVAVADGSECLGHGWFSPAVWDDGSWHFRRCGEADANAVLLPQCSPGLFRLPELLAEPDRVAVVCEGEKNVLTLTALGFVATCPPAGSSVWRPDMARHLAGRQVLLIPDDDGPGRMLMESAAGSLLRAGVRDLRFLWPGEGGYDPPPDGGDITDWLKATHPGGSADALAAAVRRLVRAVGVYQFQPGGRQS